VCALVSAFHKCVLEEGSITWNKVCFCW